MKIIYELSDIFKVEGLEYVGNAEEIVSIRENSKHDGINSFYKRIIKLIKRKCKKIKEVLEDNDVK